ncbi:MAG: Asp-tRNA(Asn)/Glu-tRNA(Gln) amidotransferase GatCAB subunit A, partial [Nitrospirae bacterium]
MAAELSRLTLHEARDLVAAGEVSSEELTRACLARIEAVEPKVHAYAHVTADHALE